MATVFNNIDTTGVVQVPSSQTVRVFFSKLISSQYPADQIDGPWGRGASSGRLNTQVWTVKCKMKSREIPVLTEINKSQPPTI